MPERVNCPRCGRVRLIARSKVMPDPSWGKVPLSLYLRYRLARRKGQPVIVCQQYVCELCTHQWARFELVHNPS